MIVAINKIDKTDSKPERVRTELLQYEVQVESLGGDVLDVEVSATKKLNLDKLLETIALQAEILDLKANPERPAEGTVIEAKLDRGRGPVATVLVQRGTLRGGEIVVAGAEWGRVRALVSDVGVAVSEAGPSVPVEVLGFTGTPDAGDRLAVVENEARAREVTDYRARQKRELSIFARGRLRSQFARQAETGFQFAFRFAKIISPLSRVRKIERPFPITSSIMNCVSFGNAKLSAVDNTAHPIVPIAIHG